ncbi:MAG: integral rane sensor signal transduction histidine kinase [Marmoricola sp.]|nr:integral rane sensor signal transduction histidine kinase [Marmoricola sp.]
MATLAGTTMADPVATDPTTDLRSQRAESSVSLFTEDSAAHTDVSSGSGEPEWVTVASPARGGNDEAPLSMRRVVGQLVFGVVVVLTVVTVGGSFAARRLAEREAVTDAATIADVLAETVVQPALSDALLAGDPKALAAFSKLANSQVVGANVVHVKLWTPQGRIVFSDETALIGRTFALDNDQLAALAKPTTRAEISSLDKDENTLDGSAGDKLVEVYRPVWTPSGGKMLFEIYAPYDQVSHRTGQLWRGFAGVTLSSLLLFLLLLTPVIWHLLSRVRRDQEQREFLLQRAVDASSSERRLIAATLHDGPVQDLAATSFVVAGATARARAAGQGPLVEELQTVSASVRTSIRALRSLLVDIYPPSLAQSGLEAALTDLAQSVRAPGLEVRVHVDPDDLGLDPAQERLVYRIAQETLRNAAKHAAPCTATLALYRDDEGVVLDLVDDGPGFDVTAQLADPEAGHLGLQLLADLATTGGGILQVASAPGQGTHWRLQLVDHLREDENNE